MTNIYHIGVKNSLLDKKHVKNFGSNPLFLYLWFLDKMTSIDSSGKGIVLGGKPIQYKDISYLGFSTVTYTRYLRTLVKNDYIDTTRAPYGLVIKVNKASKFFVNRDTKNFNRDTKNFNRDTKKPLDVIKTIQRQYKDNTINKPQKINKLIFSEDDKILVDMLFAKIQRNFNELGIKKIRKSATLRDYKTMNLIHTKDKNSYNDIKMVINWCQNDSFWKQNILSVTKLRSQFEQLLIKSQASKFKAPPLSEKDNSNWQPTRRNQTGTSSISDIINNR